MFLEFGAGMRCTKLLVVLVLCSGSLGTAQVHTLVPPESRSHIRIVEPKHQSFTYREAAPHVFITATVLRRTNLRSDSSINNPPISKLSPGIAVFLSGDYKNGFQKVKTTTGLTGWMWSKNLSKTPDENNFTELETAGPIFGISSSPEVHQSTSGPLSVSREGVQGDISIWVRLYDLAGVDERVAAATKWNNTETEAIRKVVEQLPLGEVTYNRPSEMKTLEEHMIKVRISQDLAEALHKAFEAEGLIQREAIKITTKMKVSVSGTTFDIHRLTDEEQVVAPDAEWAFTVIPLQSGKHTLHFVFRAEVRSSWGAEMYHDFPVRDETIIVHMAPLNEATYVLGKHWEFACTTAFIPLATWALKTVWVRRKRKPKKKSAYLGRLRKHQTATD